jgi:hypothetical protein
VAPRLEYAIVLRLSFSARIPFAVVHYSDGNTAAGLANLDLGTKVRLYATEHGGFIASIGLSSDVPTGNSENGIGNGHFELSPFLALSTQPASFLVFYGILADRISLGGGDHHHASGSDGHTHGSVIEPHEDHELFGRLGASIVRGAAFLSAGADAIYVISGNGTGPVVLRAEAGYLLMKKLRVALGIDVPVAGDPRFTWRARAGISWLF